MRVIEVVHLIWVDSEVGDSWTEISSLAEPLTDIHAVGFLIHQDEERYVLAVSFDPDTESANGIMHIPRAAVKKVKPVCAIKVKT
jgi:hypothetical protein